MRLRLPSGRRSRLRLGVLAALLAVVALVAGASAGAASPPKAAGGVPLAGPFDCKTAPRPFSPSSGMRGMISPRPDPLVPGDPWNDPGVPISSVYGYAWQWTTYDNGCGVGSDWGPKMQGSFGNALFGMAGALVAVAHVSMREVVDPAGWTAILDEPVKQATDAVQQSVWGPWLLLVLLLVAGLVLWRARGADLAGALNAAGWALLVMVVTTALMAYPVEASKGLDSLISTTVTAAAGEYAQTPVVYGPTGPEEPSAASAIDRQMDVIDRDILWQQWVSGLLGSAEGPVADEFGPRLFRASHLTWAEDAIVKEDPTGTGKAIIERKQNEWRTAADELKDRDPGAYDVMTGNQGRWGGAGGALFLALLCVPFLAAAALALVAAYLVIRLVIPLAPALGVVGLLEPASSLVIAQVRRLAGILVAGPILFVAALVNLVFTTRIMDSTAPALVRYVLCGIASALLWKLVRPHHLLAGTIGGRRTEGRRGLDDMMATGSRLTSRLRRSQRAEDVVEAASSAASPRTARTATPVMAATGPAAGSATRAHRPVLVVGAVGGGDGGMTVRQRREASGELLVGRARLRPEADPVVSRSGAGRRGGALPAGSAPVGAGSVGSAGRASDDVAAHTSPIVRSRDPLPRVVPDGVPQRVSPPAPQAAKGPVEGRVLDAPSSMPPIAPTNVERRDGRDVWVVWTPAGERVRTVEKDDADVG